MGYPVSASGRRHCQRFCLYPDENIFTVLRLPGIGVILAPVFEIKNEIRIRETLMKRTFYSYQIGRGSAFHALTFACAISFAMVVPAYAQLVKISSDSFLNS